MASKGQLPELGILARGLNDITGGTSTDVPDFMSKLDNAVQSMIAAGSETIIVATVPPFSSTQTAGYSASRQQLILDVNVAIRSYVSLNPELILWDVYPLLDQDGDNFTDLQFRNAPNDIHLNVLGSQTIADELITIVEETFDC